MGAELGATTSLFPSDAQTRAYLKAQGRVGAWQPLAAAAAAVYDETLELDLSALEPLIARPSSPDHVVPAAEVAGLPVAQVCIGSCVNSSYEDIMKVAAILKGKRVHPDVSLTLTPGSKQVYTMIAQQGALTELIAAGARVLESACGPCVGVGQAPPTGAVSVRSMNRNFKGRSGTPEDQVYLASPETCAAAALYGVITDPRALGRPVALAHPAHYLVNDNMILPPADDPDAVEILRGPNIKPVPVAAPVPETLEGRVLLKVGDNITTDHIMPAGAKVLPLRSNVPAIAEYVFWQIDPEFAQRAKAWDGGIVVGGINYGQGSSREHAALAPMYLGVKAVLAKSFSRIHYANLVNMGILPLTFVNEADYDALEQGDTLEIPDVRAALPSRTTLTLRNLTQGRTYQVAHQLTARQVEILLAGGLLNAYK
jgi:aconitate hydratase